MKGLYKAIGTGLLGAYAAFSSGCNMPAKADEIKTADSLPARIGSYEGLVDKLTEDNKISPSRKYTVKDVNGMDVEKRSTNEYEAVTGAIKDVAGLQTEAKGTSYEGRTNDLAARLAKIEEQVDNGKGIKAFVTFFLADKDTSKQVHGAHLGQQFYITGSKKEIADLLGEKVADLKVQYTPANELGYAAGTNINEKEAELMANTVDVPLESRANVIERMDGAWKGNGRTFTKGTMNQYLADKAIVQMRVGFIAEETDLVKPADAGKPEDGKAPEPRKAD